MKKIFPILMMVGLFLTGVSSAKWIQYRTVTKAINNEFFETEVVVEDDECMIIKNKVTGEYFLVITGAHGVSITPISVDLRSAVEREGYLMSDDADASSDSMSDGADGN